MNDTPLTSTEFAELEFLQFLSSSISAFCGETPDFRARKVAADFGAKHLPRLQQLEEKLAAARAGRPELPLEMPLSA